MMNAVFAVLFIQMQNGFCIAVGGITMALPCQQRAEIRIVVDFTVNHNPDAAVLISHRLMSSSNINETGPAERPRQRSRIPNPPHPRPPLPTHSRPVSHTQAYLRALVAAKSNRRASAK